jgi:hypothetical protein
MTPRGRKRLAIVMIVLGALALVDLLLTMREFRTRLISRRTYRDGVLVSSYEAGEEFVWPCLLWRGSCELGFALFGFPQSDALLSLAVLASLCVAFSIPLLLFVLAFVAYPRRVVA